MDSSLLCLQFLMHCAKQVSMLSLSVFLLFLSVHCCVLLNSFFEANAVRDLMVG